MPLPRLPDPVRRDVPLALAAAAVAVAQLVAGPVSSDTVGLRQADALGVALMLAMVLPVAVRRVSPLSAMGLAGTAALAVTALGYGFTVGALTVWLLMGSTALHTDRRTSVALGAVGAGAVTWSVACFDPGDRQVLQLAIAAGVGLLPALCGDALRRQRELVVEVRRLRGAELERAVAAERVRIARDVHDTVGHHLGAISLMARAGELDPDPGAFGRIATLSDRALADTRQTLGILRGDATAERRPVPSLADLPALVQTARLGGVEVQLSVDDDVATLPELVSTCAFRITQEALTNAVRHAAPARADVRIRRDAGRLQVTVRDDGTRRAAPSPDASGIAGMRERARSLGGTLQAAPAGDRGWCVHAELPVRA